MNDICGNRIAPLQGLTIFGTPHVGLRPTLVPDALSGLCRVAPLQGLTISGAPHVGLCPTLVPDALSGLCKVAPLQGLTIFGAPHVGLRPTLVPDALSGLHRVERSRANGVRTICAPSGEFLSARNSNVQCGQECPHSVRAESPTGISVGRSPTSRGLPPFQALQGRNHRRAA